MFARFILFDLMHLSAGGHTSQHAFCERTWLSSTLHKSSLAAFISLCCANYGYFFLDYPSYIDHQERQSIQRLRRLNIHRLDGSGAQETVIDKMISSSLLRPNGRRGSLRESFGADLNPA